MENELKSYMSNVDEVVSLLKQKVERIEKERDEWKAKYDELNTKYDNILATESGHESKTENVWQSGFAAGHEAASERGKWEAQPGAVWVKASERLPGWKKRVKWRDGNNHSYATDGEISLFEMEMPNLEGWEWLDESAAGREDAVEFAEWLLEYGYEPSFEKKWVDYSKTGDNRVSTAELYELFKQQKK